jgi:hypothetical protein
MPPIDQHDLSVAHDLGTIEGKLAAILENTKILPELALKVERHETQLRFIRWVGTTSIGGIIALAIAWFKTHFSPGR